MRPPRALVGIITTALLAGCPGGAGGPDAAPCFFELVWGHRDQGAFVPFADDGTAEVTLGFQGFLFVASTMRLTGTGAEQATFSFQIEVQGHEPYAQLGSTRRVQPGDDGHRYAEDVLVFFNDIPMPQLIERTAHIRATGRADGCTGIHEVTVTLIQGCFENPDGELECDDDDS
jgi:hypothetical protein